MMSFGSFKEFAASADYYLQVYSGENVFGRF